MRKFWVMLAGFALAVGSLTVVPATACGQSLAQRNQMAFYRAQLQQQQLLRQQIYVQQQWQLYQQQLQQERLYRLAAQQQLLRQQKQILAQGAQGTAVPMPAQGTQGTAVPVPVALPLPAGKSVPAAAPDSAESTWIGREDLPGYGPLEFHFSSNGQVVMVDTDGSSNGTYTVSDNRVSLSFSNGAVIYTGTIKGKTLAGTARNAKVKWKFSVSQ